MTTTMPRIHVLRHGHVHNPDKVLYGRLPEFRLSDTGEAMAQAAADHLVAARVPVTRIVASPLLRAQQTAAPVAAAQPEITAQGEQLHRDRPVQPKA